MPLDDQHLMRLAVIGRRVTYAERDAMLYALSVGMGGDPLDAAELPFVYEGAGLRTVPTLAVVLASTGILRETGADFSKILHGGQRLTLHRPLPPAGEIVIDARIAEAFDKGPGRGAVLLVQTDAHLSTGEPLFTSVMTVLARGDGGFGGRPGSGPEPHTTPDRAPDLSIPYTTRPDAALLYRLNADRNPLHADPKVAAKAGFERPILHGLATYGVACRAVLGGLLAHDPARMLGFEARFSAPVFPGDEIVTDLWQVDDGIAFRCRVPARNAIVLSNGHCRVAGTPS